MRKIEAFIQHGKLDAVKSALCEIGIENLAIIHVAEFGVQPQQLVSYRGVRYMVSPPMIKIELTLLDDVVEQAIEVLMLAAHTGSASDGKIFVFSVSDAVRICNGNRSVSAL
jgi:nitrogen regulatory protein P-II 1